MMRFFTIAPFIKSKVITPIHNKTPKTWHFAKPKDACNPHTQAAERAILGFTLGFTSGAVFTGCAFLVRTHASGPQNQACDASAAVHGWATPSVTVHQTGNYENLGVHSFACHPLFWAINQSSTERLGLGPTVLGATQGECVAIHWDGRDNTHVIRLNGKVKFLGRIFETSSPPARTDERAFYLNVAMNALAKEGYEFAGRTDNDVVMKRTLAK